MEPFFFVDIFDNIMSEYEKLSGTAVYSENLEDIEFKMSEKIKLTGLVSAYYLARYNDKGIEALKYWGCHIKNNSLEELKKAVIAIKSLQTNIKISNIKKGENKNTADFDSLLVNLENAINRELNIENLTLSKWCALIKSIKKRQKHGRDN